MFVDNELSVDFDEGKTQSFFYSSIFLPKNVKILNIAVILSKYTKVYNKIIVFCVMYSVHISLSGASELVNRIGKVNSKLSFLCK